MDILYTSLSKSNMIHEDSGGDDGGQKDVKKSKVGSIKSTNNSKTSTPFNEDGKVKSSVALNFVSPPPKCNSLIQSESEKSENQQPSDNRQRSKRIILNENHHINQQIDAEIKLKERYLKQLKSIDLAKYSFPNEYVNCVRSLTDFKIFHVF